VSWLVVLGVVAALAALRWLVRPRMLVWTVAWWLAVYVVLRFGFVVPIPSSVLHIYMAIVTASLVIYVFADAERLDEVRRPLGAFLTERRFRLPLAVAVVAIPALVAFVTWRAGSQTPVAPSFGRTIHPAPPETITVHDKEYDLITLVNPYRRLETADPAAFARRVAHGREVYYANCFFCHGDLMQGEGMLAHGLNPIPTNFQDPGTIAQLQESFLFWRISKGGPGLPPESGPWATAMPAWEKFLDVDEICDVILFLSDVTGARPRAREHGEEGLVE
jgi:hypothetical protein